ncbi:helix-turn-helix domain-containing protein [Hydrogenophaga intermedia]|uniref:helix-turn-helix domain-containing protein n=1 Tax=Hydrogenophaga intermedia TaxID=65786 RepID=UPI0020446ABB|nr:helix-turn-helix transcriptional regulator [Hydrogenophaga intermedia]MCM3565895.1 helix-turn-helix domain-containing protein [Hydrogenophaga intermedia]
MDEVGTLVKEQLRVGNRFTRNFLDQVKKALDIESDYALAKHLRVSKSTVSNYQKGITAFSDDVCHRVAEILDIEPAMVLALIELDRHAGASAKELATRTWIARVVMAAAGSKGAGVSLAACLVALGLITTPPNAVAAVTELKPANSSGLYTLTSSWTSAVQALGH